MTKFETILRLSEIRGFILWSEEHWDNEVMKAIEILIDDLSEEFQEKQDEIKLPKLTDYESYDDCYNENKKCNCNKTVSF
jgi:hypothetical protein